MDRISFRGLSFILTPSVLLNVSFLGLEKNYVDVQVEIQVYELKMAECVTPPLSVLLPLYVDAWSELF